MGCDPNAPLVGFVAKLYPKGVDPANHHFDGLVRLFSGKINRGTKYVCSVNHLGRMTLKTPQ